MTRNLSYGFKKDLKLNNLATSESLVLPSGDTNPVNTKIQGGLFYNTNDDKIYVSKSISSQSGWASVDNQDTQGITTSTADGRLKLLSYLKGLSSQLGSDTSSVIAYTNTTGSVKLGSFQGGVYSPFEDRIYFVPYNSATPLFTNDPPYYYINCKTGEIGSYTHTFSSNDRVFNQGYIGGVYSPTQNRIYFVPYNQIRTNPAKKLHYIDCNTGALEIFSNNSGVNIQNGAYSGGVYSPTQNRIYFVPYGQAEFPQWHYIDCSDGSIVSYTHGVTAVSTAYSGGVYSPTQNRIYFVPSEQGNQQMWHYIDCSDGSVVVYSNLYSGDIVSQAYIGGVYSPTQNRIYFVPYAQSNSETWHYIDCSSSIPIVISYQNPYSLEIDSFGYAGGVYSPTQNRIYFVPNVQGNNTNWHYIDCNTGSVVVYNQDATAVATGYIGGVYCPTQNRIYFVPYNQDQEAEWHYIQDLSSTIVNKKLMSGAEFNKL